MLSNYMVTFLKGSFYLSKHGEFVGKLAGASSLQTLNVEEQDLKKWKEY